MGTNEAFATKSLWCHQALWWSIVAIVKNWIYENKKKSKYKNWKIKKWNKIKNNYKIEKNEKKSSLWTKTAIK